MAFFKKRLETQKNELKGFEERRKEIEDRLKEIETEINKLDVGNPQEKKQIDTLEEEKTKLEEEKNDLTENKEFEKTRDIKSTKRKRGGLIAFTTAAVLTAAGYGGVKGYKAIADNSDNKDKTTETTDAHTQNIDSTKTVDLNSQHISLQTNNILQQNNRELEEGGRSINGLIYEDAFKIKKENGCINVCFPDQEYEFKIPHPTKKGHFKTGFAQIENKVVTAKQKDGKYYAEVKFEMIDPYIDNAVMTITLVDDLPEFYTDQLDKVECGYFDDIIMKFRGGGNVDKFPKKYEGESMWEGVSTDNNQATFPDKYKQCTGPECVDCEKEMKGVKPKNNPTKTNLTPKPTVKNDRLTTPAGTDTLTVKTN